MVDYWKNEVGFKKIDEWESDCWIRVTRPSAAEMTELERRFGVPLDFAHDAEDPEERPRLEVDEGWLMLIVRVPVKERDGDEYVYSTRPIALMMRDDVFISVSHFSCEVFDDFINWTRRRKITDRRRYDLLLALLLSSSVWYLKYLKQMNLMMKEAEDLLENKMDNEELQRMMGIAKFLVYFETSLRGNDVVLMRLKKFLRDKEYNEDLLDDAEIELVQAYDTAKIYGDVLERQQTSYSSIIGNSLNSTMKTLTIITIILMVPTLIAGLYGMNLINGMESWALGFPLVLLASTVLSVLAYYFLKIRKLL
ncbi:MAG: magnesium transporter CorA family protein [Muribaculaceae bacterium]|nr:magnesium transporter CorA family protein [Muribaculaceae bacterium]